MFVSGCEMYFCFGAFESNSCFRIGGSANFVKSITYIDDKLTIYVENVNPNVYDINLSYKY